MIAVRQSPCRSVEGVQRLRVLHSDQHLIVFEKPSGITVHPSERSIRLGEKRTEVDVIRVLRNQTGRSVFPVHRLDRATHGVMVMAFDGKTAGLLQGQFRKGEVEKKYLLMCRGWLEADGRIGIPLESDSDSEVQSEQKAIRMQDAFTDFTTLLRFELPVSCGRHPSSRFSLIQASPKTGRFHQIRRHFKKISHPLIGDSVYGDGRQNRIWREILAGNHLFLLAWTLRFRHPHHGEWMKFRARFAKWWHPVFDRAGGCPLEFVSSGDEAAGGMGFP
jgi:tRNA pseudouridine65 synthase